MVTVVVLVSLYVIVFGFFRFIGGLAAAGDLFRSWGQASSTIRADPGSSR
jgi:hypothetical protein